MKVAIVLPGGVPRIGEYGTIPCVIALLERLARSHDVHVFVLYQEPRRADYERVGAYVHNVGRGATRLRTITEIVREHRRSPFDLIHAFWATPPGVVGAAAGRLLGLPVLLHLAGGDLAAMADIGYGGRATRRGRVAVRAALAGASRITAGSRFIETQAASLGVETAALPLGVALDRWTPANPRRRPGAGEARLVHVASLNPVKDQATLLRAAKVLVDKGVRFRLDIVGEDTLRGRVQQYARELGVTKAVTFHGFLPHSALRPLVERSDLLLVTSRHEAGPAVLLEAAVAGVPTVGTAVGLLCEWAPDAAVTVRVGDHRALARATIRLLENEEQRLAVAATAQRRAVAIDADWTAAQIDAMYREVGPKPPTPVRPIRYKTPTERVRQ